MNHQLQFNPSLNPIVLKKASKIKFSLGKMNPSYLMGYEQKG